MIEGYKNKYERDNLKIYEMDCMELMKQYPDKYFDIAIVDPPYGIGQDGSKNKSREKLAKSKDYKAFYGQDKQSPNKEYFQELIRVSENQIIWGANHFISKIPFDSSCWLVWDKNNTGDFADAELAYTSFDTAVRVFKYTWNGMLQENMKNKEERIHPTQKPIASYNWILNKYSKPEFKILDTHLGSGSNAIANHYFNTSEFVACELDPYYYKACIERIQKETSQLSLF